MIEKILERLDVVKRTGPDRATARCPAHNDKSPSLSIRETDDGTLLVKCFAGCGAADVMNAIGLTLADLFPERPESKPTKPNHWHATREALKTLHKESLVCALAASDAAKGQPITKQDAERVLDAAMRIREVVEACK